RLRRGAERIVGGDRRRGRRGRRAGRLRYGAGVHLRFGAAASGERERKESERNERSPREQRLHFAPPAFFSAALGSAPLGFSPALRASAFGASFGTTRRMTRAFGARNFVTASFMPADVAWR